MNLDATAVWIATRNKDGLSRMRDAGMSAELMVGGWKEVWGFVCSYTDEHGETPGAKLIVDRFGCSLEDPGEVPAIGYLLDQMYERGAFMLLQTGTAKVAGSLEEGDIVSASDEVHALSAKLRRSKVDQLGLKELADVVGGVREMYDLVKSGHMGVPFPWEAMNDMTLGMWPGTMTFFTARPSVGKTWSAILIAWNAFLKGNKILVVSPEMGAVELAERVVAREGAINYGGIVSGQLGDLGGEKALDESIARIKEMRGFHVLDDNERLEQHAIEDAIAAVEPDLIVMDSVYMLRAAEGKVGGNKGGTRYDRILNTIDWMRGLTRRTQKPVLGISQLSRNAKMSKGDEAELKKGIGTGGLEDTLAMSDTLLWDCNNLFAMFQDSDMKLDKQMLYVPLKARRMASWSAVVCRWDMELMDFEQIGTKVESSRSEEFSDSGYSDVF